MSSPFQYDSPVPAVMRLSAPSPLRSELIVAFNALIDRIETLERRVEYLADKAGEAE